MKKISFLFMLVLCSSIIHGQSIYGVITDKISKESLVGVNIITENNQGVASNVNGKYHLDLEEGSHQITFKYIGYDDIIEEVILKKGDKKALNIEMSINSEQLSTVVVSAGKFEQKIEEITVSMEVIKPALIENKNTTDIQTVMDQVPGVNITDGQANIRGGSGWSYGAGTRVLVMVDNMPLISGDAGQVQWKLIGTENINQIEVIKGASSVLYGSSALNGIINIRTAFPSETKIAKNASSGYTKINSHFGLYDFPERDELNWSGTPVNQAGVLKNKRRAFKGVDFFHAQKIANLDLTLGGNWFEDDGYRMGEKNSRKRINFSTKYKDQKIEGLSYGLLGNFLMQQSGYNLLWDHYDRAYTPFQNDLNTTKGETYNIDPSITYMYDDNIHSLRTRYLKVINDNSTNGEDNMQDNESDLFYLDYQWQKNIDKYNLRVTSGVTNELVYAKSVLFDGEYSRSNHAFYTQIDKKWRKFNFSIGGRYEHFRVTASKPYVNAEGDTINGSNTGKPVFRGGVNYQLAKATFIRGSWGQGFRFPSIAEMFITTNVAGFEIFNNPALKPEKGWSAEIGIKQGLKLGEWKGYVDVAAFVMEYDDMMEFTFGMLGDTIFWENGFPVGGIGFKSLNIGGTQISGIELSIAGSGKLTKDIEINVLAGYTYIKPIIKDSANIYLVHPYRINSDGNTFPDTYVDTITYANSSSDASVLKYRHQHIAKLDLEIKYKKLSVGGSCRYNDFMKNIDEVFTSWIVNPVTAWEDPPLDLGINESRGDNDPDDGKVETHNKGDIMIDVRAGYQITKNIRLGAIVNNLMNVEYIARPADMKSPRTFALQCSYKL
ncbi:MAG: TonB-dependent receptor [Bacteroidota bacterium]|nr:TonB-dependent receptor [Bacteroidota bacterium]